MCKLGDIIVVDEYVGDDEVIVSKHSFVVINDKPGFIEGLRYDLVTNVMSSFKNAEHKNRKLRFMENLEVISDDIVADKNKNGKSGFIKADQLIYFDKAKIKYYVLGHLDEKLLDELILLIIKLAECGKLVNNLNNLSDSVVSGVWQREVKSV